MGAHPYVQSSCWIIHVPQIAGSFLISYSLLAINQRHHEVDCLFCMFPGHGIHLTTQLSPGNEAYLLYKPLASASMQPEAISLHLPVRFWMFDRTCGNWYSVPFFLGWDQTIIIASIWFPNYLPTLKSSALCGLTQNGRARRGTIARANHDLENKIIAMILHNPPTFNINDIDTMDAYHPSLTGPSLPPALVCQSWESYSTRQKELLTHAEGQHTIVSLCHCPLSSLILDIERGLETDYF